jgi:hypothetical protein
MLGVIMLNVAAPTRLDSIEKNLFPNRFSGSPPGEHDDAEDHPQARRRRLVREHRRAGTQAHEEGAGEQLCSVLQV